MNIKETTTETSLKRWGFISLITLALVLTGCSNGGDTNDGSGQEPQAVVEENNDDSSEAPDEAVEEEEEAAEEEEEAAEEEEEAAEEEEEAAEEEEEAAAPIINPILFQLPSLAGNWTDSHGHSYSLTQEGSTITGTRYGIPSYITCSVSGTVSGNIISGSASLDIACNIIGADPAVPDGIERELNLNLVSNDQWEGSSDVGFGPSDITLNRS